MPKRSFRALIRASVSVLLIASLSGAISFRDMHLTVLVLRCAILLLLLADGRHSEKGRHRSRT